MIVALMDEENSGKTLRTVFDNTVQLLVDRAESQSRSFLNAEALFAYYAFMLSRLLLTGVESVDSAPTQDF